MRHFSKRLAALEAANTKNTNTGAYSVPYLLDHLQSLASKVKPSDLGDQIWISKAAPIEIAASALSDEGWQLSDGPLWGRVGELARNGNSSSDFFFRLEAAHGA